MRRRRGFHADSFAAVYLYGSCIFKLTGGNCADLRARVKVNTVATRRFCTCASNKSQMDRWRKNDQIIKMELRSIGDDDSRFILNLAEQNLGTVDIK